MFLGEQKVSVKPMAPQEKRKLRGLLDELAGNVSEEDSGSWDEEQPGPGEGIFSNDEEENYYDEENEEKKEKKAAIIKEQQPEKKKPKKP